MNVLESVYLAIDSIRVNKLRAFLTLLSVTIGVFAIILSGTLITSLDGIVTSQLDEIGQNTFWIQRDKSIQMGGPGHRRHRKPITYTQFKDIKKRVTLTDKIACQGTSSGHTVKSGQLSTDPNVALLGVDHNFLDIINIEVVEGRPIMEDDILFNRNVAVIGNDVVVKIFPTVNPLGKTIAVKNQIFTVIGIMETRGAMMGQSQDNYVVIPVSSFLKYFADKWEESLTIYFKPQDAELRSATIDEAIGAMRVIRDVEPWDENSFELETNESISEQFAGFTKYLSIFGFVSGFIALIAAGVGIMNIMLVTVKERTREIGIRKAVGAKKGWILAQFLIEAITLCQVGGFFGILLGVLGAMGINALGNITLVFPVFWVVLGIVICTIIGSVFGFFPAWKAAKLDPIEALRYE